MECGQNEIMGGRGGCSHAIISLETKILAVAIGSKIIQGAVPAAAWSLENCNSLVTGWPTAAMARQGLTPTPDGDLDVFGKELPLTCESREGERERERESERLNCLTLMLCGPAVYMYQPRVRVYGM